MRRILRWTIVFLGACGALFAILFLNPAPGSGCTKTTKASIDIETLKTDLMMYQSFAGRFSTTEQGLNALLTKPTSPPLPIRWYKQIDQTPLDPWGQEYRYECPGKHNPDGYDIYSTGAPGSGPNGIIGNWKSAN